MALKPTELLEWATNPDSDKAEYTLAKKKAGYVVDDYPDYNEWNHFRYNIHLWLLWLSSIDLSTDPIFTRIANLEVDLMIAKNDIAELKNEINIIKNQ